MHSGHRDRSRSAGRIARESAENLTRWRQARRGGKSDKRRGKSIILRLLETLIQIIDATQELDFTYLGSRRRNYVQGVIESFRSNQWLPKNHEPILEGWEESDLDSDVGESLYNESEADEESRSLFRVTNLCGLLRGTQIIDPNPFFCQRILR